MFALCHSQQFFNHVWTFSCLPGLNQYYAENKLTCLRTQRCLVILKQATGRHSTKTRPGIRPFFSFISSFRIFFKWVLILHCLHSYAGLHPLIETEICLGQAWMKAKCIFQTWLYLAYAIKAARLSCLCHAYMYIFMQAKFQCTYVN